MTWSRAIQILPIGSAAPCHPYRISWVGRSGWPGQASRLLAVATGLFGGLLYLLFSSILALYLTIDGDRIRRYLIVFLPSDRQEQALAGD